jgi:hypothetical protein
MRVLFLEALQAMLDERRRLGLDRHDEMWDGVLCTVDGKLEISWEGGSAVV